MCMRSSCYMYILSINACCCLGSLLFFRFIVRFHFTSFQAKLDAVKRNQYKITLTHIYWHLRLWPTMDFIFANTFLQTKTTNNNKSNSISDDLNNNNNNNR